MKIKKKQISVLGGSGYIGSHLCDLLSDKGFYVKIFDIKKSHWLKKNQKMYIGNLLQKKKLVNAIKNSEYVFNFAALSNIDYVSNQPYQSALVNILGTINVLEVCKKNNVKKLIHASSIYANSEQGGFYGCSKKAAEDYIERYYEKYKLNFTILRFGSLYGGRATKDNGLQKLITEAKKNRRIVYAGTKKAARKFIYINDAAKACLNSLKKKYDNRYLTITGKQAIKITELVNILKKSLKINAKDVSYLNIKNNIHYANEPSLYIPRKGTKLTFGSKVNFKKNLKKLILN